MFKALRVPERGTDPSFPHSSKKCTQSSSKGRCLSVNPPEDTELKILMVCVCVPDGSQSEEGNREWGIPNIVV